MDYKDYFQAGRSVEGVTSVEPAGAIVRRFAAALEDTHPHPRNEVTMVNNNPIAGLKKAWDETRALPDGNAVFSQLFGKLVPYAATISPLVLHFEPGNAVIQMEDREGVRNHLSSVHAVALMNLGEMTSGLALAYALPEDGRSILTKLTMEYFKKARGTLTAECRFAVPEFPEKSAHELEVPITDEAGELVAKATATWLVDRKA